MSMTYEELREGLKEMFKTWTDDKEVLEIMGEHELKRAFLLTVNDTISKENEFLIMTESELNEKKRESYNEGFLDASSW